jgi:regulator of sirC expression with transglutaminase-like and TPR domain
MTPASKLRSDSIRRQFVDLIAKNPTVADLARGALIISAEDQSSKQINPAHYLSLLKEWGLELQYRSGGVTSVEDLNSFIFGELGFRGDSEDYFDPTNSYLDHCIDTRKGIPISLSVIYIEIARWSGVRAEGVGLPGHFIVRVYTQNENEDLLIDPFYGTYITEQECQDRINSIYGTQMLLQPEHLRSVTVSEILFRMLTNLKSIYMQAALYSKALAIVERLLVIDPGAHAERRDRGFLLAKLGKLTEAVREIEGYLRIAPETSETDRVRSYLKELRLRSAGLN